MQIKTIAATLLSCLTLAACSEGPSVELPEPSGRYAVGVTTATLVDASRTERFDRKDGPRTLTVTAWYPAEVQVGAAPATMLLDLDADHVRRGLRGMGVPGELADAMAATETAAVRDAPRSQERAQWPVLLFSHGYMSTPEFYTSVGTELASHGYVVVSINHSYESSAAVLETGELVRGKLTRFITRVVPQMRGIEKLSDMAAGADKRAHTQAMLDKNTRLDASLDVWLADSSFVLDELEAVAAGEAELLAPLAGGLDLEHVGALGHSFGGATSIALALVDSRVDAAINWDGFQFGDVLGEQVPVASLMIESAQLPGFNEMIYADSPMLETHTLEHLLHLGLSDLAYVEGLPERKAAKVVGTGDVRGEMDRVIASSLAHMNRYVGAPAGLR